MCCIFHKWVSVVDADHSLCGRCFKNPTDIDEELALKYPKGFCPHSFRVCKRCGKTEGYGSHGKLSLVPDTCKNQIAEMLLKKENK